jgi:hypothetical protein
MMGLGTDIGTATGRPVAITAEGLPAPTKATLKQSVIEAPLACGGSCATCLGGDK